MRIIIHTSGVVGWVAGGLEPIPAVVGQEAGYTLDRSPVRILYFLSNLWLRPQSKLHFMTNQVS